MSSEYSIGKEVPKGGLLPYLTPFAALTLSFGYAVGWGSFMMPGTMFLPEAGPLGTVIAMVVGGLAMCVFAWCYHFMMCREGCPGGAFKYTQKAFGDDHGFLVGFFLCLTYIAVLWANATSIILLVRFTLGGVLQFGFHYNLAGFDVYCGEVLLPIGAILFAAWVCLRGKRLAARFQSILATVFVGAVVVLLGVALFWHEGGFDSMAPAFSTVARHPVVQVFTILAMAPWAFVGYEAISHSTAEFKFPVKRTFGILVAAVAISVFVYVSLALLPTIAIPDGYSTWPDYIRDLPNLDGISGVPVFMAAKIAFGNAGVALVVAAMLAGQFTGIVATFIALSRLMHSMAMEDALPKWFGVLDRNATPRNAIIFITALSLAIPFFGRTVTGWPVDISSLGAAIAYGYTSAAAFKCADERRTRLVGLAGIIMAIVFALLLLVPNYLSGSVMAAESYLLLSVWCIIVFLFYRRVFLRDRHHRFGQSTVVWTSLIVIIIFSSLMWIRQSTLVTTKEVLVNVLYNAGGLNALPGEMQRLNGLMHRHSVVEMVVLVGSLMIILSLFSILRRREKDMAVAKSRAEELNKAKSYFFSTVSHDIRTPLNAIIGFSQMLKQGFKTQEESREAVDSILVSSTTLLNLINDVLDLSKLESGRMQIEPEPTDCNALFSEIVKAFKVANKKFTVDIRSRIEDLPLLMVDPQRLRQIAFNLVGNAVKFTNCGYVEVRASISRSEGQNTCTLKLEVEDTGCGISEGDLKRIATPYMQVGSMATRHGGTGLGLAICRQLAVAMGGRLEIASTFGKGSTFSVILPGIEIVEPAGDDVGEAPRRTPESPVYHPPSKPPAGKRRRILVADDQKMNLIVFRAMLGRLGDFDLTLAYNGREALSILEQSLDPGFDMVFTDMWMPEMNGEALVRAIRKNPRLKYLPVYALTADVEARGNYAEMGFTGLLLKPVTFENLKEILG